MIKLIAAVDDNLGIGFEGKLPWGPVKEDMQFFRANTLYNPVIMGRETWKSTGHLDRRLNIVMSTTLPQTDMCLYWVARTVNEALAIAMTGHRDAFVIGGAQIYNLFALHAEKLLLTHIPGIYPADVFFPQRVLDMFPVVEDMSVVGSLVIERRTKQKGGTRELLRSV